MMTKFSKRWNHSDRPHRTFTDKEYRLFLPGSGKPSKKLETKK